MDKIEALPDDFLGDFLFKIMIVGEQNTGKTSISNKAKTSLFRFILL